ncbi:MAG TPA: S1 RNA-binding domain-containing protein, partial [Candidatus Acidoferrum sp.]|nr:S1 RNA-binding domain-containing protein [Candidatus Acidoferrum sp.]
MLPDHDNQSSAAAAAPAPDSEPAQNSTPEEVNSAQASATEPVAHESAPEPVAHAAESAQEHATPAEAPAAPEAHAAAAPPPADAEATAAAEEAAGSEEMSKLMEQYDEQHEAASQNEIIEVKVVAYTEHGVVVDLGGKTEGLIPAAEFSETDIPRPEPNATIEVQRTGEHKDGFTILSYQKVLRRRTWEKIEAAYKAKETITGKVVDRIKGGLVVDIGVRAFLPGSQFDLRPTQNLDDLTGTEVQVRVT